MPVTVKEFPFHWKVQYIQSTTELLTEDKDFPGKTKKGQW